ncbi:universal stress protein [Pseudonocardia acaciae]|uniref:universal stress protein n=1 Tax=Pseudonocardia acaciae TaxID=551276 RepID=UPI0005605B76|nr:universal stress protein [Pseudonocardia acaciae]
MSTPDHATIVVGIDGTEASRAALRWATRYAQHTPAPARVNAVAVWRLPSTMAAPDGSGMVPLTSDADLEAQAWHWLDEALEDLPPGSDGDAVTPTVEGGNPRDVLLERASDAELLVLGNKSRGAIAGAIAGSVVQHCVHHARCPVLLVPVDDVPTPEPTESEE